MDTSPEDVAKWLATETGHNPEADEGYEDEKTEEGPRAIGLPQDKHEKMRRFFDGLHVEKALTEKRRAESVDALDETDEFNKALMKAAPQPGQPGQTPPGGGY